MDTATERINNIIVKLEKLQKESQNIFDTFIDQLLCDKPPGTSFGNTKYAELAEPAGSTLNYIAALKIVRDKQPPRRPTSPYIQPTPFMVRVTADAEPALAELLVDTGMLHPGYDPMAGAVSRLLEVLAFEARHPTE